MLLRTSQHHDWGEARYLKSNFSLLAAYLSTYLTPIGQTNEHACSFCGSDKCLPSVFCHFFIKWPSSLCQETIIWRRFNTVLVIHYFTDCNIHHLLWDNDTKAILSHAIWYHLRNETKYSNKVDSNGNSIIYMILELNMWLNFGKSPIWAHVNFYDWWVY